MPEDIRDVERWNSKVLIVKSVSTLIFGLIIILIAFNPLQSLLSSFNFLDKLPDYLISLIIFIILSVCSSLIHTLLLNRYFDIFFTKIFMIKFFKISFNFKESSLLSRLFESSYLDKGSWVAIYDLKKNPDETRKQAILSYSKSIIKSKIKKQKKLKNSTEDSK